MALIKCPECGKDISSAADKCVYCGYPIKNYTSKQVDNMSEETEQYPKSSAHSEKVRKSLLKNPIFLILPLVAICIVLVAVMFKKNNSSILPYGISITDTYSKIKKNDENISDVTECGTDSYIAMSDSNQCLFGLSKEKLNDDIAINSIYLFNDKDGALESFHQLIDRKESEADMIEIFTTIINEANTVFKSSGKEFSQDGNLSENKPPIHGIAWERNDCVIIISRWYGTAGPVFISVYSNPNELDTLGHSNIAEGEYTQLVLIELQMLLAIE